MFSAKSTRGILPLLVLLVVVIHAFGIMLPETGFDALWYHLPLVADMASCRCIRYLPSIPQSNQPRLGELLFLPWFLLAGVTGVKVFTFILMLLLLYATYRLSRLYLSSTLSWMVVLIVASFHTVAWQASSAYVDILRAAFEIGALYWLSRETRQASIWATVLMMGSLLTKLVSLLFFPAFIVFAAAKKSSTRGRGAALFLILTAVLIYLTGRYPLGFFFTAGKGLVGPNEIMSSVRSLLLLPLELSFHRESFLSPLFLFSAPFIFMRRRLLWRRYRVEILFLAISLTAWVFVVPISVRYDLSAIILLTILCLAALRASWQSVPLLKTLTILLVSVSVGLNLLVRVGVLGRSWRYLTGVETQAQYLLRFDNGILKGPLEKWYRIKP